MRQPEGPPDEEAQAKHRLTHVAFAAWCEGCVKTRSRDDHRRKNTHDNASLRRRWCRWTSTTPR